MRVPTVTVKCRATGRVLTINETDWAHGSIPGVSMAGWDRIGESRGDGDEAVAAAQAQRELVEKQAPKGAELDAKSKSKSQAVEIKTGTTKKAVTKKKTTKKKTARKTAKK